MSSPTIDTGIDLGTTNSSIACVRNGQVAIVKNEENRDITPSCVYYGRNGNRLVGAAAEQRRRIDLARGLEDRACREFKTSMGTDARFRFPGLDREFTPEELSADILQSLRAQATDAPVNASVIAIPAAFGQSQVEATQRAAELAGLEQVELIPEPLAASLAYCVNERSRDGRWLVFDLGGGTFDAVLMGMHEGLMRVIDIAGDPRLGGKDIDALIVDQVIVPHIKNLRPVARLLADRERYGRLRRLLRCLYAEDAKIALSTRPEVCIVIEEDLEKDDSGAPLCGITLTLTQERLAALAAPLVDRTLRIVAEACQRAGISPGDLSAVLPVGGPTLMPCVRNRLREEFGDRVNAAVDPMTAVARGAAIFAGTVPLSKKLLRSQSRPAGAVDITIAYPETTVESEVAIGIRVESAAAAFAEVTDVSGRWHSGRLPVSGGAVLTRAPLAADQANRFSVRLFDAAGTAVPCTPDSFTILQGIKIENPPLPMDICLEVSLPGEGELLKPIVRRGDVLPATGILRDLRTRTNLRPGRAEDAVTVPVYEGDALTRPIYNRYIGELRITGAMVEEFLPAGSEVTVTMRIDTSRRKTVSAYVDYLDKTFECIMEPLHKEHHDARETAVALRRAESRLRTLTGFLRDRQIPELTALADENRRIAVTCEIAELAGDDSAGLTDRVRELNRGIDALEKKRRAEITAGRFREELDSISTWVRDDGTPGQKAEFSDIERTAREAIATADATGLAAVTAAARGLWWRIASAQPGYWTGRFESYCRQLDTIAWQDQRRARELADEGRALLARGWNDRVKGIVSTLSDLAPDAGENQRMDILEVR